MVLNFFKGICLTQKSVSFLHKNTLSKDLDKDFTLGNCLFGAVKLTKNTDPDKYKYSSYVLRFDSGSEFLWTDGSYGKNIIIFGYNINCTESGKRVV